MAGFPLIGFPYFGGMSGGVTAEVDAHVITVASVVDYISTADTDPPNEDLIADLIDEVFAEFIAETGQPIENDTEYVHYFDGRGSVTHTPALAKVNGFSTVEGAVKLSVREYDFTWTTIDADTFTSQTPRGAWQIYYPYGFQPGRMYKATLDVGYATIPDDIKNLVRYKTVERYYDSVPGGNRFGQKSQSETTSVTITTAYDRETLQKQWDKVVRKYRVAG